MKYFAFLTLLMIVSYLPGFVKRPEKFQWMDRNFTTAIKGFAILTVVWTHSGAMLSVGGIQFIAGIGVALFLICSGYGLEISYEKNGLKDFWKKRLLGVCFPFWVIEFIGLLLTAVGTISYEIYLVHAFTLNLIKPTMINILIFIVITYILACVLHVGMRKIKND